jgi:hypothetical protein
MPDDLRRFILTSIQSVPFVEAILLFMGQAGLALDAPTVARRLYVSETTATELAAALAASGSSNRSRAAPPRGASRRSRRTSRACCTSWRRTTRAT